MKLTLIDQKPDPLAGPARERLLRETVRAELAARGVVTRRWLVTRVCDVLQLHEVTEEEIADTIEQLDACDDLTSGSHGRVAPTPLRLVDLDGRHLVVGTMPSAEWRIAGGPPLDEHRLPRLLASVDERLPDLIACFGGLRIPLTRWAGLDRTTPAGQRFLDELDARREMAPRGPEDDADCPWQGFHAAAPGPFRKRWRSIAETGPRLWRRFLRAGYTDYAWTDGAPPSTTTWTPLGADDAVRALYSLTRRHPVGLQVSTAGEGAEIRLAERIPHAEYRWLVGAATSVGDRTFQLTTALSTAACAMLRDRLGIEPTDTPTQAGNPETEH